MLEKVPILFFKHKLNEQMMMIDTICEVSGAINYSKNITLKSNK